VRQLGANAHGEILEPGRVPDCYLGLRLDPAGHTQPVGVLVVGPAALLHPSVPQPNGTLLYELLTGHPDRAPHELVFLADLTVELRAWPTDTWSKVGVDPQAAADAVVAGWRRGDLLGLRLGGLTAEEALATDRRAPAQDCRKVREGCRWYRLVTVYGARERQPCPRCGRRLVRSRSADRVVGAPAAAECATVVSCPVSNHRDPLWPPVRSAASEGAWS
jgi:hypothetical protein